MALFYAWNSSVEYSFLHLPACELFTGLIMIFWMQENSFYLNV